MLARLAIVFMLVGLLFSAAAMERPADATEDLLQAIVAEINTVRAAHSLGPVAADGRLTAAAAAHAANLAALGRLSHDGFGARMQALGASYRFVAENLAAGMPTPSAVVAAWMQSPAHRANLLQPSVTAVGAARVHGARPIWTLILAQRA